MKSQNQKFSFSSAKELFTFKDEVEWMGRYVSNYNLQTLELTVSPFPEKSKKKADAERKAKAKRESKGYDDDNYEAVANRYK